MRKFLIVLLAAFAAITFTSCDDSNKEGTYNFPRTHYYRTVQHSAIYDYIVTADSTLANNYLVQRTGKRGEVINLEIEDFINRCEALDADIIRSYLDDFDDYYQITLWVFNPLQALISVKWTKDQPLTLEKQ